MTEDALLSNRGRLYAEMAGAYDTFTDALFSRFDDIAGAHGLDDPTMREILAQRFGEDLADAYQKWYTPDAD